MTIIHIYPDGSKLLVSSAKEVVDIPIWKGNRLLDIAHANKIKENIGFNIQSLGNSMFRTVSYYELDASNSNVLQTYIIDGQHRAHVLRQHFKENMCEEDFPITVTEKHVSSESEAIEYFNVINNVKAMSWEHDPRQLANKYLSALDKRFKSEHKKKGAMIRPGNTKRPYLSSDVLREQLIKHIHLLKYSDEAVVQFVKNVQDWNAKTLRDMPLNLAMMAPKDAKIIETAIEFKFTLAYYKDLRWIQQCL